jgi:ribosomal protein S6
MKLYELDYLISSNLTEIEIKDFQEKIISFVQEKGILIDAAIPKKRVLAYPVKKNNSAFFATLNFQMKPENLADFEKKLKPDSRIIRYLILNKVVPKAFSKPRRRFTEGEIEIPERKKVKIEEIEEKLKEVLEEKI